MKAMRHARTGHIVMFPVSKRLVPWRKLIQSAANLVWRMPPTKGSVEVHALFILPEPKWFYGPKGRRDNAPCDPTGQRTGDIDKYLRAVLDSLTGVVYEDDSQVVCVVGRKLYSNRDKAVPGAEIQIVY